MRGAAIGKTCNSVSMAKQSRAYVYDCCGATKTSLRLNPLATYVKESTKNTVTVL